MYACYLHQTLTIILNRRKILKHFYSIYKKAFATAANDIKIAWHELLIFNPDFRIKNVSLKIIAYPSDNCIILIISFKPS